MTTTDRSSPGRLYVVATPIGNLEDMTFRAVNILKRVSLIAAEDTRHSRKLLNTYGITTPLVSYFRHRERQKLAFLLDRLENGGDVALISDAGTPGICDPGAILVAAARARGCVVEPVPGASALAAAISISGFNADRLLFLGFLSPQAKRRQDQLLAASVGSELLTLVFYEAPHRIQACLADCLAIFGDVPAVVCRELTKLHEEILSGALAGVVAELASRGEGRGEFVVMLQIEPRLEEASQDDLRAVLEGYRRQGYSLRDAVVATVRVSGAARNGVYRLALPLWS